MEKCLFRAIGALFLCFVLFFLLGACNSPLSLSRFITENTDSAQITGWEISEASRQMTDSNNYLRSAFKKTWSDKYGETFVFYIDPFVLDGPDKPPNYNTPRDVELIVDINNPQGYSLAITPEYSVYNPSDVQVYPYDSEHPREADKNRQRTVSARQSSATTAVVSIGHAVIGERFEINLHISMNDGSRVFETYTSIPCIVFNTMLSGPRNLALYSFKEPEKTGSNSGDYYPFARWEVPQLDEAHPGINKITLVFQEQRNNADWVTARFVYETTDEAGGKIWSLNSTSSDKGDVVSKLTVYEVGSMESFRRFEVRFPMQVIDDYVQDFEAGVSIESDGRLTSKGKDPTLKEIDSAFSAYNFIITLEDQCGLIAQSGFDDGPLANDTTILESVVVRNVATGAIVNEGFYIPGFVNYTMDIPYDISSVRIEYTKNSDYPDQNVSFANSSDFDIPQGNTRSINFTVTFGSELPTNYMLSITRLSPIRDSYLKNIYAEIAETPGETYDTLPAFIPANTANTYTIYLRSQVNSVVLNALLPEMRSGDPGYGTLWPAGTLVPSIVSIEGRVNDKPAKDGSYKRVDGKWTLPLDFGSNLFHIVVKPEAGLSTTYTVIIARALQSSNDTADLSNLAISGNASGAVALAPSPFDGRRQESYTVNVPNVSTGVTISATVKDSRAVVTNIRTPGVTESLPITRSGNVYQSNLSGLEAGGTYPVTITVVAPDGVSRRDYHVLVNRMLPTVSPDAAKEEDHVVVINWNQVSLAAGLPGTVSYELYYSTANISNFARITADAYKWPGSPVLNTGKLSARVTGLENAQRYYFYLRAMNGGIPGEWTAIGASAVIQPRSNNANLSGVTLSGGNTVLPVFSPAQTAYTVVIPYSPGSLTITGSKGEPNQTLTPASGTITVSPNAGASTAGTIAVQAHDPSVSQKVYQFTVHRRLPAPTWNDAGETNNEVTLNWNAVLGASLYDVRYHTADISDPALIEHEAVLFGQIPGASTSCSIMGLDNARTYYFWVRARITGVPVIDTVPGEWSVAKMAMPKSNDTSLAGITVTGGPPLIPLNFDPAIKNYSLIIPAAPGSFSIEGLKREPNQSLAFAAPGGIPPGPGGFSTVTFTVTAHDGTVSSPPYSVRVDRMLGGPQWLVSPPLEGVGKVTLTWGSVASAGPDAVVYETYYNTANTPPVSPPSFLDSGDAKWKRGIAGTSTVIDGLANGTRYYFWVRAVAGTIPGEWSAVESAMPRNDNAKLAMLAVKGNDNTEYVSSADYNGNTFFYEKIVPAEVGTFNITIKKDYKEQEISFSRSGGSAGSGNAGANILDASYTLAVERGKSASLAVTVRPHDGSAPNIYTIIINRKPETATIQAAAKNRSVDLSWNSSAGASSYELYWHTLSGATPPAGASLLNVAGTSATVKELVNTTPCYFWLRSRSESGLNEIIYGEWTIANATPKSDVAELSSLSPSAGFLSPSFSSNVETYYLISPSGASGPFTLSAVAADGGTLDSGTKQISLNSTVSFTVTSQDSKHSKIYTVHSQSAGVSVTFVQPVDTSETIELSPQTLVSWAAKTPIVLSANGNFSGYELQWYKDSAPIPGATDITLNVNARDFSIAQHTITLRIKTPDGHIYSKSLLFTVER